MKTASLKTEQTKGILLLALGHSYYGNYAATLASSIKFNYPNLKICLAHAGDAINIIKNDARIKLFDSFVEIPKECYQTNGVNTWIKAKNYMYDFSPFDSTLFLDVDMIMFPRNEQSKANGLNVFFDEMESKGIDFTISNRDFMEFTESDEKLSKYSLWANIAEVKAAYKFKDEKYYSCHSEFIYFTKCKKNDKFFALVKEVTENLKVKHTLFGLGIPDELPFAIAMAKLKHYPHQDGYVRIFWENTEHSKPFSNPSQMYKDWFGLSLGGNDNPKETVKLYNLLASFYGNKQGLKLMPHFKKKLHIAGREGKI